MRRTPLNLGLFSLKASENKHRRRHMTTTTPIPTNTTMNHAFDHANDQCPTLEGAAEGGSESEVRHPPDPPAPHPAPAPAICCSPAGFGWLGIGIVGMCRARPPPLAAALTAFLTALAATCLTFLPTLFSTLSIDGAD
jgi:hypothetical protein